MAKRWISILLILTVILLPMIPSAQAVEADPEIGELVEQQYEAFARSKDKAGMDERALWDMVNHAMYGRGRTKVFGNDDAITAVMLNSEMYKATVIKALTTAVTQMEWFSMDEMKLRGSTGWYDYQMKHQLGAYDENGRYRGAVMEDPVYTGILNDNDTAMILVVGSASSRITVSRAEVTDEETVYDVEFYLADGFDFDNTYEDMEDLGFDVSLAEALTNLGKLLALGLIQEYTWYLEANFQLRIPNHCDHGGRVFEWGFYEYFPYAVDGPGKTMNEADAVLDETGENLTGYFKLEETVHLFHDRPWVVEFEADSDSELMLSATANGTDGYPYLMKTPARRYHNSENLIHRQSIMGGEHRLTSLIQDDRYVVGVKTSSMMIDALNSANFEHRKDAGTYVFRLENRVAADGSNMVHLYVDGEYVGPMDEYYLYVRGNIPRRVNRTTDGISGMDFSINYLGDKDHPLEEGIHSLKIWESGIQQDPSMIDDGSFFEPTCTEQGFFAYSCRICHKRYPAYYVDSAGHRYEQNLRLVWDVWNNNDTARVICSDCGELSGQHGFFCEAQPDSEGFLQIRAQSDAMERNTMTVVNHPGVMDLSIPMEDPWLEILVVSYDSDGRMTDVYHLDDGDTIMLPLQDHTIKLMFLNKYTHGPMMPQLQVTAE